MNNNPHTIFGCQVDAWMDGLNPTRVKLIGPEGVHRSAVIDLDPEQMEALGVYLIAISQRAQQHNERIRRKVGGE